MIVIYYYTIIIVKNGIIYFWNLTNNCLLYDNLWYNRINKIEIIIMEIQTVEDGYYTNNINIPSQNDYELSEMDKQCFDCKLSECKVGTRKCPMIYIADKKWIHYYYWVLYIIF